LLKNIGRPTERSAEQENEREGGVSRIKPFECEREEMA
jgi:hypothetical protein